MPQTAATLEQRLKVLDRLVAKHPDLGYELISTLLNTGHDYATPSSRPVWREDDAGAGRGVSPKERNDALCAFADREVSMAHGVPERLAALVEKIDNLSNRWAHPILAAIHDIGNEKPGDDAFALLRDAIRKKLHRLLNYRDESDAGASVLIEKLQELYRLTEPDDLSWRHSWLFENSWVDLPDFTSLEDFKAEDALRTEHRKQALQEILDHSGLDGLLKLAAHKTDAYLIGCTLGQLDAVPHLEEVATFLVSKQNGYLREDPIGQLTSGYLNLILKSGKVEPLERFLLLAREAGHDPDRLGRLLSCAPQRACVWDFLESQPEDVQASYWRYAPLYFLQDAGSDRAETIINCLLDAKRPYTALNALKGQFGTVSADTLARILEAIAQSQDDEERWPLDSYSVTEIIKAIEKGDGVAEYRIVQLEFLFFRALSFDRWSEAQSLYRAITTEPAHLIELIKMAFKERSAEARDMTDQEVFNAENAFDILFHGKAYPGLDQTGTICPDILDGFVDECLTLAAACDRHEITEQIIGQMLSHVPDGSDGVWPHEGVRALLDRQAYEDLRDGFVIQIHNNRGVHSATGGAEERALAARYRAQADALILDWPRLAGALNSVAEDYERQAQRESVESRLRREI